MGTHHPQHVAPAVTANPPIAVTQKEPAVALHTIEPWIPEEWDGPVVQKIMQTSAVEAVARPEPMGTQTKHVPRSGGMGMDILGKGDSYTEDANTDDEVLLTARKFGRAISLADEDIADTAGLINVLNTKRIDWATAYAKGFDNACLGTVGAESVAADRPFTSVYQALRTTNSGTSYTADDNYVRSGDSLGAVTFTDTGDIVTFNQNHGLAVGDRVVFGTITTTTGVTAGTTYYVITVPSATTVTVSATAGGATLALTTNGSSVSCTKLGVTYNSLSRTVGLYEQGDWFDPTDTIVIASPAFKQYVRDIKDTQGRPIFVAGNQNTPDTLFEYPVKWSLGARVATAATPAPTGNPLLVVANRQLLIVGRRSGPESYVADAASGVGFMTDETKLKVRARRAFALGHEKAAAVLEAV